MLKLYRNFQAVQRDWMRNHPVQYIVLNVTLFVVGLAYVKYKDRQEMREIEIEIAQQEK